MIYNLRSEKNLTPQAFSYATLGKNSMIYVPPYGLNQPIDFMIKINPKTYEITKIKLKTDESVEKWQKGIVVENKIYFLPYNETNILVVNTDNDSVEYIPVEKKGKGKYVQGHIFENKIIAIPYGEHEPYTWILELDLKTHQAEYIDVKVPILDTKLWHTTQLINDTIYGLPRGENHDVLFPYRIEYNCKTRKCNLVDMSIFWKEYDKDRICNKKFTTLAKFQDKLFAPPYSESDNFDLIIKFDQGTWSAIPTNLKSTSRKYYTHQVSKNGKIYFPPAGHDENWSTMLIIDINTDTWYTKDLGLGKESKKYFAGIENSRGRIYYIPRGGCVCEPEETWKMQGDLAEILVIDTADDNHYTINISDYFIDNTTIEKYNDCVIIDDTIFAFPYGETADFQTVLIFDTLSEKIIQTLNLNDV